MFSIITLIFSICNHASIYRHSTEVSQYCQLGRVLACIIVRGHWARDIRARKLVMPVSRSSLLTKLEKRLQEIGQPPLIGMSLYGSDDFGCALDGLVCSHGSIQPSD